MKTRLLPIILLPIAIACNPGEPKQEHHAPPPGSTASTASQVPSIDNSRILNALYSKSRADSAVYDAGKLIQSSSFDKQTIAKVLAKQVFQRHDSTLCFAIVKNEFSGAGANNGWMDGILLYNNRGAWQKLKEKRQLVGGSSFGSCDCQCQITPMQVNGEKKYLAFVRVYNVHQGEYLMYSVATEDLRAQQNDFMVFESGMSELCPGFADLDPHTMKIGLFVKPIDARNDKLEVVSYEERNRDGKCTGKYVTRDFTYTQMMEEVRRPRVVLE